MSHPVRNPATDKKVPAGVMAIFVGLFGVHKFFLGYTKAGMFMLFVSLFTCGIGAVLMLLVGIVEGVIYLTKTDDEFESIYVRGRRAWF